jgi:DNA-binding transcriptional MocR family regulator
MPTDDRPTPAHDERRIEVTGSMVDGGIGGIQVGRDLNVASTVPASADALTQRDLQLVQSVLDAAQRTGPAMATELTAALQQLAEEVAAEPARSGRVRASLEQVAIHAGTAGAVFAAAQLALDHLT